MDQPGNPLPAKRVGRKSGAAKAPAFAPPVMPAATALAAVQAAEANAVEIAAVPVTRAVDAAEALAGPVAEAASTAADAAEMFEAAASPAVPSDPTPAAPPAPPQQGPVPMATIAPNFTDTAGQTTEKLQSLFGDMGARAKASFEKQSKLGEELVELTRGNVEAVVASARVAAKGGEVIGQDVAEYGKKSFESAVAAMKSFASVKSPTELFQLQSEFAKASFDSAVAEVSRFSETFMKLAGDVAQPLSTRYAVAAEKIKAATL